MVIVCVGLGGGTGTGAAPVGHNLLRIWGRLSLLRLSHSL